MSKQPKVFLVDDDPGVRQSLQCVLESTGLHIEAFSTADDFLAHYDNSHPSCVILDLRMPGMTGEQLLQHLQQNHIDIPVIIITAHGDIPTAVRSMRLGALDFCQKPVDPDTLLALVKNAIEIDTRKTEARRQTEAARQQIALLTPRERELLTLLVDGKSYKEIASALGISVRTVEHHRAHLNVKLGLERLPDLVRLTLLADPQVALQNQP